MPDQSMAPSLAESWTASRDGLVYEFVLCKGVKFHNGDPVTAEDGAPTAAIPTSTRSTGTRREMDPKKREALLHRIQQLMHEKVMFAPIVEPAFLNGPGARVAEAGLGLIVGHLYSAPYQDLRLKK
jgi:ABC-type transport system substrate-binding protein